MKIPKNLYRDRLYTNYRWYIMSNVTTIQLDKKLVKSLKESREYPRQTYEELISKMLKLFNQSRSKNQYDEFLHKIQQQKMKELWDNTEDGVWENV